MVSSVRGPRHHQRTASTVCHRWRAWTDDKPVDAARLWWRMIIPVPVPTKILHPAPPAVPSRVRLEVVDPVQMRRRQALIRPLSAVDPAALQQQAPPEERTVNCPLPVCHPRRRSNKILMEQKERLRDGISGEAAAQSTAISLQFANAVSALCGPVAIEVIEAEKVHLPALRTDASRQVSQPRS